MNATDTEQRIRDGFKELLEELRAPPDPLAEQRRAEHDRVSRETAKARVREEYAALGLVPPCEIALSITARLIVGTAVYEHREAAE